MIELPTAQQKNDGIEETLWAKEFKKDSPVSYKTAIEFAKDPTLRVEIDTSTESGTQQWVICASSHDPSFWMDAKSTRAEAETLCKTMGWKLLTESSAP